MRDQRDRKNRTVAQPRHHENGQRSANEAVTKALARARGVLGSLDCAASGVLVDAVEQIQPTGFLQQRVHRDSVEKTIWGSPAGKKRLAGRLAALLPPHKTYVEPFAGSGAVLFAKEPAEVEAINDADAEIVQAYRIIQRLSKDGIERLRRMKWTGDEATFKRLIGTKPGGDVAKLHRFLYLTHFSYGKMRGKSFSPSTQGIEAKTVSRIETHGPRLKGVKIHGGDYLRVIRQYDGQFPYVAEKRGVIFIRRSLKEGLRFARHKNNDESLRAQVLRTIKAFLTIQMNNGAFQSKDPKKAFFIEISDKPSDIQANKLTGRVGLAMNKATDWVVIGISADTRALEEELAG